MPCFRSLHSPQSTVQSAIGVSKSTLPRLLLTRYVFKFPAKPFFFLPLFPLSIFTNNCIVCTLSQIRPLILYSLSQLSFGFFVSERHSIDPVGKGESFLHLRLPIQIVKRFFILFGRKATGHARLLLVSTSTNPFKPLFTSSSSLYSSLAIMKGLGITSAGIAAATWFAASAVAQLDPIVIKVHPAIWIFFFFF